MDPSACVQRSVASIAGSSPQSRIRTKGVAVDVCPAVLDHCTAKEMFYMPWPQLLVVVMDVLIWLECQLWVGQKPSCAASSTGDAQTRLAVLLNCSCRRCQ